MNSSLENSSVILHAISVYSSLLYTYASWLHADPSILGCARVDSRPRYGMVNNDERKHARRPTRLAYCLRHNMQFAGF